MRRVVFVGNCQVEALGQLYSRFAGRDDERVDYVPGYEDLTPERAATLEAADLIVEQRMDVAPRAELDGIRAEAERLFVPLLGGGFVWPFAGAPHPRNESLWFLHGGPYDGEIGDSWLNRVLERGEAPEDAAAAYLALDVNSVRNLDRLREIVMDRQRARDAACGYHLAEVIEEHFCDEPVFRTPHHPNLRLTLAFAEQVFARMGAEPGAVRRLRERLRVTPFPKNELPVHPSVAGHFGLRWAVPDTRYRFHDEAPQTFAEYALRYARYEWNRALAEGIALAGEQPEKALPLLAEGLIRCPASAGGWFGYAEALRRCGRPHEAVAAGRRGVAADPADGRQFYALGHSLAATERYAEAAEAAERAVELDPFDEHFIGLRAAMAVKLGRRDQAEAWLREALALLPDAASLHNMLGAELMAWGRVEEALEPLRRAAAISPAGGWFHMALSHGLLRAERWQEALQAAEIAASAAPENSEIVTHLANLRQRKDPELDIAASLWAAIIERPNDPALRERLGHVLMESARPEEAAECFRAAAAFAPDAMGPLAGLSHALTRMGQIPAALAAAEQAAMRDSKPARLHVHIGNLLRILGRPLEAAEKYRLALVRDPESLEARQRLDEVLAEQNTAGDGRPLPMQADGYDGAGPPAAEGIKPTVAPDGVPPSDPETVPTKAPDDAALYQLDERRFIANRRSVPSVPPSEDFPNAHPPGEPTDFALQTQNEGESIPLLTHTTTELRFGAAGNAEPYQLHGWSSAEDGFTWSIGHESALVLPPEAGAHGFFIELALAPFIAPPRLERQHLEIRANGQSAGLSEITEAGTYAWYIPGPPQEESHLVLTFAHVDAQAPAEVTNSGDTRVLGFAFESVRIHALSAAVPGGTGRVCNLLTTRSSKDLARQVERLTGLNQQSLALLFESLGDNCELGFFQRVCGAEPLGLLRFSSARPEAMVRGLDQRFAGLGEAEHIKPQIEKTEWMIAEDRYGLLYHTFVFEGEATEEQMRSREARKIAFLRRKFLEDLDSGEKIFVCKTHRRRDLAEVIPLYLAFRRQSRAPFLWLTYADSAHPAGLVEELHPGFLCGRMARFAPPENVPEIPFEAWLCVCANAAILADRLPPRACLAMQDDLEPPAEAAEVA